MIDATGNPQTILLLGGTSEIGLAIVERVPAPSSRCGWCWRASPATSWPDATVAELTAAGRDRGRRARLRRDRLRHPPRRDRRGLGRSRDIDVAIVAFGLLGDAEELWQDQAKAVQIAQVNYTGAVSVGVLLGQKMKAQGYGQIIAMSTVAGEQVRRSNFVYGSTKAGLDGFYRNCSARRWRRSGRRCWSCVPARCARGCRRDVKEAPLTVDKEQVATQVVDAARKGKKLIWVPPAFQLRDDGAQAHPRPDLPPPAAVTHDGP